MSNLHVLTLLCKTSVLAQQELHLVHFKSSRVLLPINLPSFLALARSKGKASWSIAYTQTGVADIVKSPPCRGRNTKFSTLALNIRELKKKKLKCCLYPGDCFFFTWYQLQLSNLTLAYMSVMKRIKEWRRKSSPSLCSATFSGRTSLLHFGNSEMSRAHSSRQPHSASKRSDHLFYLIIILSDQFLSSWRWYSEFIFICLCLLVKWHKDPTHSCNNCSSV